MGRVWITEVAHIPIPMCWRLQRACMALLPDPPTSGLTGQLRDGRSAAVTLGKPPGSPTNPVSIQQLKMKFADCARKAVRPLADEVVRDVALTPAILPGGRRGLVAMVMPELQCRGLCRQIIIGGRILRENLGLRPVINRYSRQRQADE